MDDSIRKELIEIYSEKFISNFDGFKLTNDDWCGTFCGKYVAYAQTHPYPDKKLFILAFFGNDDLAMEKEFSSQADLDKFIEELPEVVDMNFLYKKGFWNK